MRSRTTSSARAVAAVAAGELDLGGANLLPEVEALDQKAFRARIELHTPDAYYSAGTL